MDFNGILVLSFYTLTKCPFLSGYCVLEGPAQIIFSEVSK